jgi:hypothetical protein
MAIEQDGAFVAPPPEDPVTSVSVRSLSIDVDTMQANVTIVYVQGSGIIAREESLILQGTEFGKFIADVFRPTPRKKVIASLVAMNRLPNVTPVV